MTAPPLATHGSGRPMLRGALAGLAYTGLLALSVEPLEWWPFGLICLPVMVVVLWPTMVGRPPAAAWRPALGLMLGATPGWAWLHGWVFGFAWLGGLGLALYLSVCLGVFVWLAAVASRRWGHRGALLAWPAAWLGVEWLRASVFWGGYAWYGPASGLIESPWLSSAGGVIGLEGVGVLTALLAAGVVAAARGRERFDRIGGAGLLVAVVIAWAGLSKWGSPPRPDGPTLRVGAIQTATPQSVRGAWGTLERLDTMEALIALTRDASLNAPAPDVIVWPETLFPGDTLSAADVQVERDAELVWFDTSENAAGGGVAEPAFESLVWRGRDGTRPPSAITRMGVSEGRRFVPSMVCFDTLMFWQETIGIPMLVGADAFDALRIETNSEGVPEPSFEARYNSAHLIVGGQVASERYDKHHLTPFGEVMPVIEHWPALENWLLGVGIGASGMSFDLTRGDAPSDATRFSIEASGGRAVRVATPICFEATSARVCRELAAPGGQRRADVFIGLTNDGWFGRWPVGRGAHLDLARWRCMENWTPMIRSANSGVSASIDARGRVVDSLRPWDEGVLIGEARTLASVSPYGRGGFAVAWLGPLAGAVLGASLLIDRLRRGSFKAREADGPMQAAEGAAES